MSFITPLILVWYAQFIFYSVVNATQLILVSQCPVAPGLVAPYIHTSAVRVEPRDGLSPFLLKGPSAKHELILELQLIGTFGATQSLHPELQKVISLIFLLEDWRLRAPYMSLFFD